MGSRPKLRHCEGSRLDRYTWKFRLSFLHNNGVSTRDYCSRYALPLAASLKHVNDFLHKPLKHWLDEVAAGKEMATPRSYMLEYKYAEEKMSLEELESNYKAVVQKLVDIRDELNFDLFLALLEKREIGYTRHGGGGQCSVFSVLFLSPPFLLSFVPCSFLTSIEIHSLSSF